MKWRIFLMVWSLIFGSLAVASWYHGWGTPTVMAFCTGFHLALVIGYLANYKQRDN